MAIEHRLDRMSGGDIRIPPFLPESMRESIGGAIAEVYGWDDAFEMLREGRRDMAPFYRIVSDESGRLDRLAGSSRTKLRMVSYRSKAADDIDLSGFMPLYQIALGDAVRYIEAARSFVIRDIDEAVFRKTVGCRSYIYG